MKNAAFFFLLFLLAGGTWAQEVKKYRAVVIDNNTQRLVNTAAVYSSPNGEKLLEVSDSGTFTLIPAYGFDFEVRAPGYYVYSFSVDWEVQDTLPLTKTIPLVSHSMILQEAEVLGRSVKAVDTLRITDFDMWSKGLVLLSGKTLLVSDFKADIKYAIKTPLKYRKLERDVRDNLFLFSKDSVYQVFVTDTQVYFYQPFPLHQYESWIDPLELVLGERLIMRHSMPVEYSIPVSGVRTGNVTEITVQHPPYHNKGVDYICFEKGKSPRVIFTTLDTVGYWAAQDAFQDYLAVCIEIEQQFDLNGYYDVRRMFERDVELRTYQHLYAKWIPYPLYKKRDTICVFDHQHEKVFFYDLGFNPIGQKTYSFPKKRRDPLIIQDLATEELYQYQEKSGMVYISKISESWQVQNPVEVALFAKELKIFQKQLYYLDEHDKLGFRSL